MILKGRTIKKGKVEGEAIVSELPFSFLGDLNVFTGQVMGSGHDLEGQSIANKIFVFPTGKGSTAAADWAYMGKKRGNAPIGMICQEVEPTLAMVAITHDIPMVDELDQDPLKVIHTGDQIKIDATEGIVEIIKKGEF